MEDQFLLSDCDYSRFAGIMPSVRAAMRRAAGKPEGEGRKVLIDKINSIAKDAEIQLTGGRAESVSLSVLDKWLSPSDSNHPPSILAFVVFCRATGDVEPLRVIANALGVDLMNREDKRYRDYGKADLEMKNARKRKKRLEEAL